MSVSPDPRHLPAPDERPLLTLITNASRFSGNLFFDIVEQALQGGVDAVLVREKQLTSACLLAFASRLRELTYARHARLIIHSQADIAAAVDADGVHLAGADISNIATVRQWLADEQKTVSVSCHNADELGQAAICGADYAMLSPVFATDSHPGTPPLGSDLFYALKSQTTLPVIALGGIDTANCHTLKGQPVAVIGALLNAGDPQQAAQQMLAVVKCI